MRVSRPEELDVAAAVDGPPTPVRPRVHPWAWTAVVATLSVISGTGWLLHGEDPLAWAIVPFTMLGNSLAMVPYDWFLPAYVQEHPVVLGVVLATGANVVIEFWNMDVLARVLSRDGTAGFRGHRVTTRLLGWYRKAPWWTLTVAGLAPIIPFYPCRFLATLARYPIWKYQTAVVVGRSVRYTALAGIGLAIPVDPKWYLAVGVLMLGFFVYKYLSHREEDTPS